MKKMTVQFCWIDPEQNSDLELPRYHSALAAGLDVSAAVCTPVVLNPGRIDLLPSGFSVAIPEGYELQVRPRSGMAIRHGVTVVNSPGTIDADYRGEVRIGLINLGQEPFIIHRGDRIAQLVLAPVLRLQFEVVERLDTTSRADGGFGHTGK
ncbi:MAG: dUTP diphosphatase [Proteobacteria bacterium]|jgi:dUTP pyrophosphatase|nr:dUTP diphosphatase [Desulfocapsa sp.]MBU3943435.1 dUTP diphosphatase [Pseudomonadota bacterium]MCG2743931.1 dUTP diphosphatase [Desulfobacteraceae bacterium]MBU3984066.1 dUTP diphosphatase [Pseudomonadota bacterium]MBU4030441.1 dUTP diphosphatase [Pseudomonadota bacterium]